MCVFNAEPAFALAGIDCALSGGLLWFVEKGETKPTTFFWNCILYVGRAVDNARAIPRDKKLNNDDSPKEEAQFWRSR